jgi:hypothetical protein
MPVTRHPSPQTPLLGDYISECLSLAWSYHGGLGRASFRLYDGYGWCGAVLTHLAASYIYTATFFRALIFITVVETQKHYLFQKGNNYE